MPGAVLSLAFFTLWRRVSSFRSSGFIIAGLVFGSSTTSLTVVLSGSWRASRSATAWPPRVASGARGPSRAMPPWNWPLRCREQLSPSLPYEPPARSSLARRTSSIRRSSRTSCDSRIRRRRRATMMGATFPVIVGALADRGGTLAPLWDASMGEHRRSHGGCPRRRRGVLIATLGVRNTSLVAAASRRDRGRAGVEPSPPVSRSRRVEAGLRRHTEGVMGVAAHVASIAMAGRRQRCDRARARGHVWFRFLTPFVLSTTPAASLMVAAVLGGIAPGALPQGGGCDRTAAINLVPWLALCRDADDGETTHFRVPVDRQATQVESWTRVLWFVVALAAPTAAISGALFTALGDAFKVQAGDSAQATAQLAFWNTLGALISAPARGIRAATLARHRAHAADPCVGLRRRRRAGADGGPRDSHHAAPPAPHHRRRDGGNDGAVSLRADSARLFPGARRARYSSDGSTMLRISEGVSETIFLMEQRCRRADLSPLGHGTDFR